MAEGASGLPMHDPNASGQHELGSDKGLLGPSGTEWESFPASQKYHPGGYWELRQNVDSGPGQQCVYDPAGRLLNRGEAAGTPDLTGPEGGLIDVLDHYRDDVETFNSCMEAGMLNCYLWHRPPNQGGAGCPANPPGMPLPKASDCGDCPQSPIGFVFGSQ